MDYGLAERVAVVLGSTSGVGLASAEALLREGALVVICGRNEERLKSVHNLLSVNFPGRFLAIRADMHTKGGRADVLTTACSRFGHVDILVVNTPGGPKDGYFASVLDSTREQWIGAFRAKVETALAVCRAVIPDMRVRCWGRIVNIGTFSALEPPVDFSLSTATRLAMLGILRTLANEVGADGITVNSVLLGHVQTEALNRYFEEMGRRQNISSGELWQKVVEATPIRRILQPEEVGAIVAFLCSRPAGAITGQIIRADGGYSRAL